MIRRLMAMALAGLIAPAFAQAPPASISPTNTAAAASRDLWLGTEGRYLREWMLLGPLTTAQADEFAPLRAAAKPIAAVPGAPQEFARGGNATWRQQRTYGDLLDGFSANGMKPGDAGLALATVQRTRAGKATLLVGGNVRGVWVNGAWLGGAESSLVFRVDDNAYDADLVAGENRILLRVERVDSPVLLTLRVVDPGYVDGVAGGISPGLGTVADGMLLLYPGTAAVPRVPEIKFEVIAPGGRVVATATAARDTVATLATRDWPDGPYEVRVTGQNQLGDLQTVHLPWFKGDPVAGAKAVLAAAAAPGADGHLKMLADMINDRIAGDPLLLHSPLMEYAELLLERSGKTGGERARGFVRLAWTDDIDGSTQFCRAYLPAVWPAQQPAAALAFLHGYNPPNPPYVRWWSIADRHNGVAERNGLVVLEPMGRGNVDYRWMGERDVLKCIEVARKRFHLDEDRVYVTGESMGGGGTWFLASRHPDVFAAAAPVFGGWDYRINENGYAYTNPQATRPMERFVHEAHASFAGAEGLLHVPLYVLHGDIDPAVSVAFSRHGVGLLQRWGYDVRYREIPGRGHEDLKARDEIAAWLLEHRRARDPREVRLRSYDLAGASAYWVRVSAWENPFELIEVRATLVDNDTVRLDTKNVAALSLTPPLPLRGAPLTVIWNGRKVVSELPKTGVYGLAIESYVARGTLKNDFREGRLTYFFNTPFAIVIGTSAKDPAMTRVIEQKAAALVDIWERWQHVKPRVFRDTEITPGDAQRYSLLLLGGPAANAISARLAPRLPLKITPDAVTIDGRKFAASDAVAQMLYPHPENDQRFVLLVAPTSAAGMRFWNPQQYWHALNGFPMNFWDWTLVDGRRVNQSSGLLPDRGWIAAGVFDNHWRRDDRFVVAGDAEARAAAPLRRAPPPDFKLPAAALDALVGRYAINPGQIGDGGSIDVARSGDSISATAPEGGRAFPLEAETNDDFALVGLGTPVSFRRDGAGNVTGLVYHYNGQAIVATRLTNR